MHDYLDIRSSSISSGSHADGPRGEGLGGLQSLNVEKFRKTLIKEMIEIWVLTDEILFLERWNLYVN